MVMAIVEIPKEDISKTAALNTKITKILAIIIMVSGILVMFGWIADIGILKSVLPQWVTMKFITALCFLLSGIILYSAAKFKEEKADIIKIILIITGVALISLAGILLISSAFGAASSNATLFYKEEIGAVKTTAPGRPSIATMANFILIGIAAILTAVQKRPTRIVKYLGCLVLLLGLAAILGYILDVPALYFSFEGYSTAMAFHTALLFVMWGAGIFLLEKNR